MIAAALVAGVLALAFLLAWIEDRRLR